MQAGDPVNGRLACSIGTAVVIRSWQTQRQRLVGSNVGTKIGVADAGRLSTMVPNAIFYGTQMFVVLGIVTCMISGGLRVAGKHSQFG